jgi:CRISPR-associated protein Csm5
MRLLLEMLTPVHIGSGEKIDPYEYVITDKLYIINLWKFISSLSFDDKEKFLKISSSDMIETRKFIKEKADLNNVTEYSMNVHRSVHNIYTDKIGDEKNSLSIQTCIKTLDRPYIPGSSVKGPIRTALLFSMADKPIEKTWRVQQNVFKFKSAQDDPFRALSISDSIPIDIDNMLIFPVKTYAKNKKKNDKFEESGYIIIVEGTNSYYTGKTVKISHDIAIDNRLQKQKNFIDINPEKIASSCNEFYGRVIEEELNFYENSDTSFAYDTYKSFETDLPSLEKEGAFMLRLGWGSGYNSMTINLAKETPESKVSRRLIRGEFPLGWVKAKILEN